MKNWLNKHGVYTLWILYGLTFLMAIIYTGFVLVMNLTQLIYLPDMFFTNKLLFLVGFVIFLWCIFATVMIIGANTAFETADEEFKKTMGGQ